VCPREDDSPNPGHGGSTECEGERHRGSPSALVCLHVDTLPCVNGAASDDDPTRRGKGELQGLRNWRHTLDETFRVSLVLKGIDGVLELIGSLLLLAVSPATLDRWAKGTVSA
jgi:hypothetical protein